jgi:hypothetical protein
MPLDTSKPLVDAAVDGAVSVPPPSNRCPADDDLTLCLDFEQAIGDSSPRQVPVTGRNVEIAVGPSGRAARFAREGAIEVDGGGLFSGDGGTIEVWVNPGTLGRRMGVVDGPYRLVLLSSGSAMCVASGGYALANSAVSAMTWTSLACTFGPDGVAVWIDGRKARETAASLEPRGVARTLIGREEETANGFDGILDNVRLWRKVRTADQICAGAFTCAGSEP